MTLDALLRRGLEAMQLELSASTQTQLLAFLRLLEKWNRAYNLTAIRQIEQMVPKHLLDSLSILPYIRGPRALDIGTGAGLPGIPLALARPDISFTLLDSNNKKIRFVRQAVQELGLKNVEAIHTSVEQYQPTDCFDCIVARALATIPDMLKLSRHLLVPHGVFLAMKGVFPQEELTAVDADFRVRESVRLTVPELDATRHVVILESISTA